MIQSACRIVVVTIVFLVWLAMGLMPFAVRANDDDDYKPKPKPPVVKPAPVASSPSNNRKTENLLGAAAFSGIFTTALRDKPNGHLWAFGGTVAGVALIEAGHSDSKMSNVWWGVGGAAIGTVGTCRLFFNKNNVGCAFAF